MRVEDREEMISHLPALRAFALSLVRSPSGADDAVQDAIVKAMTNFDKFERGTNMRAWLFTILRNTYYSSQRKYRRERDNLASTVIGAKAIKPDHDGFLQFRDFLRAFDRLPDEQREVLSDEDELATYPVLLGPAYDQMVADGVSFARIKHAAVTATFHFMISPELAEANWKRGAREGAA